jgi:hypothetical protein
VPTDSEELPDVSATREPTTHDGGGLGVFVQGSSDRPRAFVSYAWSGPVHMDRVRAFADRLIGAGVEVIIDIYDNRPGHDLYAFMERVATDESVGFVLVIADQIYAEKADNRSGGVGTETQLISREVYAKIDQEKVVPLIFERAPDGEPYLPAYISGRYYIDFSDADRSEAAMDELLRHLYGEQKYVKPPLGARPRFATAATHSPMAVPQSTLPASPPDSTGSAIEGLFVAIEESKSLPNDNDSEVDDLVIERISFLQPAVRALLVELDRAFSSKSDDSDLVWMLDDLLSRAKSKQGPAPGVSSWSDLDYDHIGFVVHEIATAVIALLVKHRKFAVIHRLVYHTYFYELHHGEQKSVTFEDFFWYSGILDERRKNRLQLRRVSVAADVQKEHSAHFSVIDFAELVAADSLLHLLTRFHFPDDNYRWWFPRLSVFAQRHRRIVSPLGQLVSRERGSEIAKMFGASDTASLVTAFEEAKTKTEKVTSGYREWDYNVPSFTTMFPDGMGSMP